jgi:hypothetical protein
LKKIEENINFLWKKCKLIYSKINNCLNKKTQKKTEKGNKTLGHDTGKVLEVNFCKPTSKQVKKLKRYFENDENGSFKNGVLVNDKLDGKNLLIEFLKFIHKNSVNEKIPKAVLIENHLGIDKPKRLELSNWAKEKEILILMPNKSYQLNINVDLDEIINELEMGEG